MLIVSINKMQYFFYEPNINVFKGSWVGVGGRRGFGVVF